jgi:hypothetical protein
MPKQFENDAAKSIYAMGRMQTISDEFRIKFNRLEANYHKELIELGAKGLAELMPWTEDINHARNIIANRFNLSNNQANDMVIIYERNKPKED